MKKITGYVKLQLPAGKANPAPPVGPALGAQGVNIMQFCKEFNAKTAGGDMIIPVVITVYSDRSFSFIMKTPPVSVLLKKTAGLSTEQEARRRLQGAEQGQGRDGHRSAGARAGQVQDPGHEHDEPRSGHAHRRAAPPARWESTSSRSETLQTGREGNLEAELPIPPTGEFASDLVGDREDR